MVTNNQHNLTKVIRTRSDQGVFSDYPHFYKMAQEGKESTPDLFAERQTENGEFVISSKQGDFTLYGQNYVGILKPNFLGTQFELFNHGFEELISR